MIPGPATQLFSSITEKRDVTLPIDAAAELRRSQAELLRCQQELEQLSFYDRQTGLPNRNYFEDRLRTAVQVADRTDTRLALLHLNVDDFRRVNEAYGRDTGDLLIKELGHQLRHAVRDADFLAHAGGDEFLMIFERVTDVEVLASRVRDICEQATSGFLLDDHTIRIGATVGIALYPEDILSRDAAPGSEHAPSLELQRLAALALREARSTGDAVGFADPHLTAQATEQMSMMQALHNAIDARLFDVHYQTIHETGSLEIVGVEALVRWADPHLGPVGPDVFIPLAERMRRIAEIDQQVLDQVLTMLDSNRDNWPDDAYVTVNWSAQNFDSPDLLNHLIESLNRLDIPPAWIAVELTETSVLEGTDSTEHLARLRHHGVRVLLDDFGTGYSALRYLSTLPLSTLKIDRSFTNALGESPVDDAIMNSVVAMSASAGLQTVVEGVETDDQLEHLRQIGAPFVQGYLLSRPVPAEEVLRHIRNPEKRDAPAAPDAPDA